SAGASGPVFSFSTRSNSNVIVGGYFNMMNGTARGGVAGLKKEGSLQSRVEGGVPGAKFYLCYSPPYGFFCQGFWSTVRSMALQTNGHLFVGGSFNQVNLATHNGIVLLNGDGSLDTSFQDYWTGSASPTVYALAVQPDGKVIIAGDFGITRLN